MAIYELADKTSQCFSLVYQLHENPVKLLQAHFFLQFNLDTLFNKDTLHCE